MFDCALCASSPSLFLSDCVCVHMTSAELKMQTFLIFLSRPQNTGKEILDVI